MKEKKAVFSLKQISSAKIQIFWIFQCTSKVYWSRIKPWKKIGISNSSYIWSLLLGMIYVQQLMEFKQLWKMSNSLWELKLAAWLHSRFVLSSLSKTSIAPDRLPSDLFLIESSEGSWKIFSSSPCLIFYTLRWLSNLSLYIVFA